MAKAQTSNPSQAPKPVTKEGFKKFSGDVVGFHDCETQGPICGIPRGAKASDSQLDTSKPSLFVIFELLDPCKVTEGSGGDATELNASKGDMVGVWMKGGMRGIRQLCGVPVLMQYTGEKKLKGKPAAFNAMKVFQFDIGGPLTNQMIPIIEDNRKDSRDVPTFLDPKRPGQKMRQPGEDSEDDFDFPS